MIGLDTSHVIEFTKIFQSPNGDPDLQTIQVVAAFPGGTSFPLSQQRIGGFTDQVAAMGIEIVDSIPRLIERVDAVMLESVDGSVHLEQSRPVLESGKPLFIDKPIAHSLVDGQEIQRLSINTSTPCFSASSLRFSPTLQSLLANQEIGEVLGAATWGPCHLPEGVPDFYFYGIHGIEVLFALMGRDCKQVTCVHAPDSDVIVGSWGERRIGTYHGIRRGSLGFGATLFGSQQNRTIDIGVPYRELCVAIARFFKTGIAPVSLDETIEIYAFMDAANASKQNGGTPSCCEQ